MSKKRIPAGKGVTAKRPVTPNRSVFFEGRLLRLSKFFLYLLPVSVLVVLPSALYPYVGAKQYLFRCAIALSLGFFILWWGFEAESGAVMNRFREIASRFLFLAVSAFVLVFLLATFLAHNSHIAFWSNYERGDGGFQMVHYYVFFVLLIFLLRKDEDWQRIFLVSLIVAALMILYGIIGNRVVSITGINTPLKDGGLFLYIDGPYSNSSLPATRWHRLIDARFMGSLGTPSYVSSYLLFSIFYALFLLAEKLRTIQSKNEILSAGFGYGVAVFIFLFFFLLAKTRGALLGLFVAVAAGFILFVFLSPRLRRPTIVGLFVLVFCAGLLLLFRDTEIGRKFVSNTPGGRIFDFVHIQSLERRIITWQVAWRGFLKHPLLGWGPENFSYVLDRFFDPRLFQSGVVSETWWDKAHSVVFDRLSETGVLGFLSYLSVFVVFYYEFFKRRIWSESRPDISLAQSVLLFALPVAYFVQGLVFFDGLPTYLNLFLVLAFAHHVFYNEERA